MSGLEGRTFACRNGDHWACPSTDYEWSTCGCDCHLTTAHNREVAVLPQEGNPSR